MIAQILQKVPEIKYAMIGNMQDNLGADKFVDSLLDMLEESGYSGAWKILAQMPAQVVANVVKVSMTPDERAIVDANPKWFEAFKKALLEEWKAEEESEDEEVEETAARGAAGNGAAPQPAPVQSEPLKPGA